MTTKLQEINKLIRILAERRKNLETRYYSSECLAKIEVEARSDPVDLAQCEQRLEEDKNHSDAGESELRKVCLALDYWRDRLNKGMYSLIGVCGHEIERDRLGVLPYTLVCAHCAGAKVPIISR